MAKAKPNTQTDNEPFDVFASDDQDVFSLNEESTEGNDASASKQLPDYTMQCSRIKPTILYRRAFSELHIINETPEPRDGDCVFFLTGGDVDSLTYLKFILRFQPITYCLASTWCMAIHDIRFIEEMLNTKQIKSLDFYVGEIFRGSYSAEYAELKRVITPDIGRICIARNHAKVYAGFGDKFHFVIHTSANINTNPRMENAVIAYSKELFEFHKAFFDKIISIDRGET